MKQYSLFGFFLFLTLLVNAQSHYPGQHRGKIIVPDQRSTLLSAFDLQNVQLLESPFKQNMERNGAWLLSINTNRLLHNFRVNAGLPSNATALGGWEKLDVELRGHTMGHVLSGLALMYASTGNDAYKKKADSLVAALAQCQQALGKSGYLSAYPENLINRVIAGQPVWAPWYTLHKIFAGLLDTYLNTDNKQALDIATKMASWAYQKLASLSAGQLAIMMRNEFGGMNDVFYTLYAITGNQENKMLAEMFFHHRVLDPLSNSLDSLNRLHANTQIPKITGAARGYEITGDEKEKKIAQFFWQTVIDSHTYANGGNSDDEHFFEPKQISNHLSPRTTETCNTYNMLKLTNHLFEWTADSRYGDYYEQALYNHILAAQDPETGMASYFMPFKPGLFKVYSTKDSSFWCCVGTAFESNAKFGEAIYYHDENKIYVNLFIPSRLTWEQKGMKLVQETTYPESDKTTLTINSAPPGVMSILIRFPSWATSGAFVTINGKKISIRQNPGSFITLDRKWKNGDKIEIRFPMSLRYVPAPDNPNVTAIAYGPVLLAGAMGTEGLTNETPYAKDQNDLNNFFIPDNIVHELNTKGSKDFSWLHPGNEALNFRTTKEVAAQEITLIPYYKIHHQRYVVYWNLK
ncbi:MAG: beta-L-arabinofuranosidase domain-containing protein [Flavisolibacter sp.]